MSDGDDYDEAADRVANEVPDDLQQQSRIREWVNDNIDWGHDAAGDTGTLNKEVSDRIAEERRENSFGSTGSRPPETDAVEADGRRKIYDPAAGQWRDAETGSFTEAPGEGE